MVLENITIINKTCSANENPSCIDWRHAFNLSIKYRVACNFLGVRFVRGNLPDYPKNYINCHEMMVDKSDN